LQNSSNQRNAFITRKALRLQLGENMKKTLHEKKDQFLLSSRGRLIGWGTDDVKNLIIQANKAIEDNLHSRPMINGPETECLYAFEWFKLFVEDGITKPVVEKLNSRLSRIRYHHILIYTSSGPYWRRIANADAIDDPGLGIAYCMAHLLEIGAFKGLKRCAMKNCQKFFIGPPNKTWCSKKCGSLHRVRQKRRKNKANGIEG
jgi:hypothetical protein